MGIFQKQFEKILAKEILKYLLKGTIPSSSEIGSKVSELNKNKSKILYKYIPQSYKETFNYRAYNKALNEIKFDIDLFQEELLSLFVETSKRINFADLYHKINSYELNNLRAELEMLLFSIRDADFYFSGNYDTFCDYTKTNRSVSSSDIIDLVEQCLILPYKGKSTKRIDVSEIIDIDNQKINIVIEDNNIIYSSKPITNSKFGNIFTDMLSVWAHEILTTQNVPLEIYIDFPIGGTSKIEKEYFVSRFEIIPHVLTKTRVKIQTSNDDVNYLDITGHEEGIVVEDQKKTYAMDFETTLVQYVRLRLSKLESDEEVIIGNNKYYRYLFGIKSFAAYQAGRTSSAVYESIPFSFDNIINKVSLESVATIPAGCKVNYYVASSDISGENKSDFIPINPIGFQDNAGVGSIVSFNKNKESNIKFEVPSEGEEAPTQYGSPYAGISLKRVGPAIDDRPIFGKTKLYRGYKAWSRDVSGILTNTKVEDTYINFGTDTEKVYAVTEDIGSARTLSNSSGIKRTMISLTKPPYYDSSKGHEVKSNQSNSSVDNKPNYAIYDVTLVKNISRETLEFQMTTGSPQYLPATSFIVQSNNSAELPILSIPNNQNLELGKDYELEVESFGGISKPTGRFTIPSESVLRDGSGNVSPRALRFTYTFDSNITNKVSSISGNNIILNNINLTSFDTVKVTYRFIPLSPNSIIKNSFQVSNLPSSSNNRIYYTEGVDFSVDESSGTIQRIGNGSIQQDGHVYVSFMYKDAEQSVQTFSTWAYLPVSSQVKFDVSTNSNSTTNNLVIDNDAGEAFYVNTVGGLVNLNKANSTPTLPAGWVQFVVRSKNPDTNTSFRSNLIDQVIQLRDNFKQKIFRENNRYFNTIIAFREPLKERTVNHLKVNTLYTDHTVFAIDSITDPTKSYIVLNYTPNTTTELYCKQPSEDSDDTGIPVSFNEQYNLYWTSLQNIDTAQNSIIVKIELIRDPTIDGGVTPKVFDYKIRIG